MWPTISYTHIYATAGSNGVRLQICLVSSPDSAIGAAGSAASSRLTEPLFAYGDVCHHLVIPGTFAVHGFGRISKIVSESS